MKHSANKEKHPKKSKRKNKKEKNRLPRSGAVDAVTENVPKEWQEPLPIEQKSHELLETIAQTRDDMDELYTEMLTRENPEELEDEVKAHLHAVKKTSANALKAYQRSVAISDELHARWRDARHSRKRLLIPAAPANAEIDREEKNADHFARGMNCYKLLWICFIGSFAGVVVELLWCLLTRGYIESRSGLVYGPFNLLYGVGAVAMSLALYHFRNRGKWMSFLGGFVVGSVVEYICSWVQEKIVGSYSWDYSQMPFNINGRICLIYSLFWGVLGVLWIKSLYPRLAKLILKIPNRVGKILTWVFVAFFIINIVVSLIALLRWSQRINNIDAANAFWRFVDSRFPNERMKRIYPNMYF